MSREATQPAGRVRGALFLATGIVLVLGLLELALGVTRRLWEPAPRDPVSGLDDAAWGQLSDTVAFQLSPDRITVADDELIFRVRSNPGGGPVNRYEGIGADGFRNGPRADARRGDRVVLLAGDSCAFGWGLLPFEATLGAALDACLAARAGGARLVNVAQPGHSTSQTRLLLERITPALRPELVILYGGWNDLWETRGLGDEEVLALLRAGRSGALRRVRASSLYRFLEVVLRRTILDAPGRGRGLAVVTSRLASPSSGRVRVPIARSRANLVRIADLSRDVGAKLLVVEPPFDPGRSELAPMQELVRDALPSLDGRAEIFRSGGISREHFQPDGYHPSAEGAAILAAEICAAAAALLGS